MNQNQKKSLGSILDYVTIVLWLIIFPITLAKYVLTDNKLKEVQAETSLIIEDLTFEKNERTTLEQLYAEDSRTIQELNAALKQMKETPQEVKYIVRTQTKIVEETKYVSVDLPQEYLFDSNGLVVARFSQEEEGYNFQTYELTLDSDVVVTDNKTAVWSRVYSSYNVEEYITLKTDVDTTQIIEEKDKIFSPDLNLGIGISSSTKMLDLDVYASLSSNLLHYKDFDFIGLGLAGSENWLGVQLSPISYNVGHPLPIVQDLSIVPSVILSSDLDVQPALGITTTL